MDLGLKDKVAIVVGSSRGLGKAIASTLADEGCNLALCARGEGPLLETAAEHYGFRLDVPWKKLGKRDWYAQGAWWLLDNQETDGSWNDTRGDTTARRPPYLQTADTCFAILFLSLATPPLTGK